ncbi:MAG: 4Fe-4S dicluster domain-containing protein [Sedimentisphaerales bacterium]|nr:4Fe-4S dicluster domain-containing protein [Sedimentisphaerales bacterium]
MRKPKLREIREALKSFFSPAFTSRFPARPAPAPPAYRGKGLFHEDKCIGCGACAEVCPADAIEIIDDPDSQPPQRTLIRHDDICIFCGQCQALCTTGEGIECTSEYELSTFDRKTCAVSVAKELYLCYMCGKPITTKDHLRWLADKLGPRRYTNPTLILVAEEKLKLISAPAGEDHPAPDRRHIMQILCPHCRRQVLLREIWG